MFVMLATMEQWIKCIRFDYACTFPTPREASSMPSFGRGITTFIKVPIQYNHAQENILIKKSVNIHTHIRIQPFSHDKHVVPSGLHGNQGGNEISLLLQSNLSHEHRCLHK